MTWWSFVERIVVPTVMLCLLAGSLAGIVFSFALALRSGPTLQFIARMNRWYSSRRLVATEERMLTPLEPHVEAHPRAAGWIIAVASLAIALAMAWLLVTRVMH